MLQLKSTLLFGCLLENAFLAVLCTTTRCIKSVILKSLRPPREKLMLPDAAVALSLPEVDVVNH